MTSLTLRPFEQADFPRLIDWITTPLLLFQWSSTEFHFPLDQAQLEPYWQSGQGEAARRRIYTALGEQGQAVGHIELNAIDPYNRLARVARVLIGEPGRRGQGLGERMVRQVLQIGFETLGLHRIELSVFEFNTQALRCYERIGFVNEGLARSARRFEDRFIGMYNMSLLEDEWRPSEGRPSEGWPSEGRP